MINEDAPPTYDLCAVSQHTGTQFQGHYTATARHLEAPQDHWFRFDDAKVFLVNPSDAVDERAYILVYRRSQGCLLQSGMSHQ